MRQRKAGLGLIRGAKKLADFIFEDEGEWKKVYSLKDELGPVPHERHDLRASGNDYLADRRARTRVKPRREGRVTRDVPYESEPPRWRRGGSRGMRN
jgi:hypothetical protein